MAKSDHREGTSSRQDRTVFPPAVQPGGLYTRQQIANNLNTSDETIKKWIDNGLRPIPNTGTGTSLFFADEVLRYLTSLVNAGD